MANPSDASVTKDTANDVVILGSSPKSTDGGIHPNRRRIIKAAPPKGGEGVGATALTASSPAAAAKSRSNSTADDKDDDQNKNKKQFDPNPMLTSVGQDDTTDETAVAWQQERFKTTEKRAKALREKELAHRRATPTPAASADANANPFSRFKSIFSVEPQFPEHKRTYEKVVTAAKGSSSNNNNGNGGSGEDFDDDESAIYAPEEKRLKPSEDDDNEGANRASPSKGSSSGAPSTTIYWVTAAAVVAIGVAFVLQRGRKK